MAKTITLDSLSPEEKQKLLDELKAQEAAKADKINEDRKAYKALVNETVPVLFEKLKKVSQELIDAKAFVYKGLADLVTVKSDVYGREDDQASHSFTSESGVTIIIGNRETDGWDDTVNVGVGKVNDILDGFIKDDNSKMLVKTIRHLLSRDKKGNLKISRITQLRQMAEDTKDENLIDAIKIIHDAYRPNLSKRFVTCRYKNDQGLQIDLPLSISDADYPETKESEK